MIDYLEKYKYPFSAMLNVTDNCNLQCRYCFVEQHPHYMSLETAQKAADWLYNNYQIKKEKFNIPARKCSIYFFGGEPTLCFDTIIYPLVNYCNKKYPNQFTFGMTTNGTLLNEEKIRWLKEQNFNLLLSIDGNKETQDYNRPCRNNKISSFDLLEKNIPILLKYFPNLSFRATIYKDTLSQLFNNYLFFEKIGVKSCDFIYDTRAQWNTEDIHIFEQEIEKIYAYRLEQILSNKEPMLSGQLNKWLKYIVKIYSDEKITKNKEEIDTLLTRCGLGTTSVAIGWDGKIYGCQEQVSQNNKNIFYIGNINQGLYEDKHQNLLNTFVFNIEEQKNNNPKCQKCKLQPICYTKSYTCPSANYTNTNNLALVSDCICSFYKIFAENTITFLLLANIFNNEKLNNYIQQSIEHTIY